MRPSEANFWVGWCERAAEQVSVLTGAVSLHRDAEEEERAERSPLPILSLLPSTPTASRHHLPVFSAFPAPFILGKSVCMFRPLLSILATSLKSFSGRLLPRVTQSARVARGPAAAGWRAGGCAVKPGQLISFELSPSRFFLGPCLVTLVGHTPSMRFPYAVASSGEATKNRRRWFGLRGNG